MTSQNTCSICEKDLCDFETRCGHIFHSKCLHLIVFSKERNECPACKQKIYSSTLVEKLIHSNGDVTKAGRLMKVNIFDLKELIVYGLKIESFPLEAIVEKMIELGWNINEFYYWLNTNRFSSLFYASYISGKIGLTNKLIGQGCKLFQVKTGRIRENESVLPHAAKINDLEFIKKLVDMGVNINSLDQDSNALYVAFKMGHTDVIDYLLSKGAEFIGPDCGEKTELEVEFTLGPIVKYSVSNNLLNSSCFNGSVNTIKSLYKYRPNLLVDYSVVLSAFIIAIKQEKIEVLDLLFKLTGNVNVVETEFKRNLLMFACASGNLEIVKSVFVNTKCDPNVLDALGYSAILYSRSEEIVKFLINNGAYPFAKTRTDNYTVLHFACHYNNYELIEYLLTNTPFAQMDLKALLPAKKGLVQLVLEQSKEKKYQVKIIEFLLKKGVNLNEKNLSSQTALMELYYSIIDLKILLAFGADVNAVDSNGLNCLQKYLEVGKSEANFEHYLRLIIENGINLNSRDNQGQTIMHHACKKSLEVFILEYLLESGAKTDIPDANGFFPFDTAFSMNPFSDFAKFIEKRGLNFSKFIPNEVRSRNCDQCKGGSASLKARCGHYLHINCLKNKRACPVCDSRVTCSHMVETIIKESNFNDLISLHHNHVLLLFDNYIEDDNIISFDVITREMKRRQKIPINLYAKACAYGRLELIKIFDSIIVGNDVVTFNTCSMVFSAISGKTDMIEYFLEKLGTRYIDQPYDVIYPIHIACLKGNLEFFDFLVGKGARLNVNSDYNLLQLACDIGAIKIVKRLVESHGFKVNFVNCKGSTLLHQTVIDSDFRRRLLERKIITTTESNFVHEKTEQDRIAIAKYLLDRGVNMHAYDDYGNTPVSLAGLYNFEKLFDFFVNYSKVGLRTPFKSEFHRYILISIARCGNNLNIFEKVVKMDANVNWADSKGFTALMEASLSGNYEMCCRLIELGANVNAVDNELRFSAVQHVCDRGNDNVKILELLLSKGANAYVKSSTGETLLHLACRRGYVNTVMKLLSIGIYPNCFNSNEETPLHLILTCDSTGTGELILSAVESLIEAGADINLKDCNQITPLIIAKNHLNLRKVADFFNKLN